MPNWLRVLGVVLTPLFQRLRQSGRIPGVGRRYRWFLRGQHNLAPALHSNFFWFAERLTDGQWQTENPEQVLRLMVNALLEDLREAFRSMGWRRPYRTTFPVVLLDGITRNNGGYALVRMVSAVRNDTGLSDPLLLITTSTRVPPLAEDPQSRSGRDDYTARYAKIALSQWTRRLLRQLRKRNVVAWLVIIHIPDRATGAALEQVRIQNKQLPTIDSPRRHPLRTRRAAVAIAASLVVSATGTYIGVGLTTSYQTCSDGFTWLGIEGVNSDVQRIDGVCVGVSDGSNPHLLPESPDFDQVRLTILRQYQQALKCHRESGQPLITLVFMGSLTAREGAEDSLTAEREQLAGMAVAQSVQLAKPNLAYEPLVRVLIANAGPGMAHGRRVARQLGEMARTDPSIVGVIGLSESRSATVATIEELTAVGLPVVSGTLSADSLVSTSKLFFQISPQNRRQAEVAAAYAEHLVDSGVTRFDGSQLTRGVRIYRSDDAGDIYSQNLASDLRTSFTARGFSVETVSFSASGDGAGEAVARRHVENATRAGNDACDFDGIVFYAGRGLPDFASFLSGVSVRCVDRPPYIMAGDDVTRYVAHRNISRANRAVPFDYLSFAVAPDLMTRPSAESIDFYTRLYELFPYERTDHGRSLDGHAAMNYDAAFTAILAVSHLLHDKVAMSGGTLWPALMSVTDASGSQQRYQGVTGRIDFGGSIARRVPLNKPITIVRFFDGAPDARDNIVCGARTDSRTQPWCPFDS